MARNDKGYGVLAVAVLAAAVGVCAPATTTAKTFAGAAPQPPWLAPAQPQIIVGSPNVPPLVGSRLFSMPGSSTTGPSRARRLSILSFPLRLAIGRGIMLSVSPLSGPSLAFVRDGRTACSTYPAAWAWGRSDDDKLLGTSWRAKAGLRLAFDVSRTGALSFTAELIDPPPPPPITVVGMTRSRPIPFATPAQPSSIALPPAGMALGGALALFGLGAFARRLRRWRVEMG